MDDQNQQNLQGGAQPQGASGDTALPWMSFSPDPTLGDPAAASSTGTGSSTTDPTAPTTGFDPFGNPFAAGGDTVTAPFAPSSSDGSSLTPTESTPFVPSEPSAFTPSFSPEPEVAPQQAPVQAPATDTLPSWNTDPMVSSAPTTGGEDSLSMLDNLKAQFDREEEEFNEQIKQHNDNIQYEKDAIAALRSERSEKLAKMRKVVEGLQNILGGDKREGNTDRPARPRHEEPRRADRVPNKPKNSDRSSSGGLTDLLAA